MKIVTRLAAIPLIALTMLGSTTSTKSQTFPDATRVQSCANGFKDVLPACSEGYVKSTFYRTANLEEFPAKLSDPLQYNEVDALAFYYVANKCPSGRLASIEKRSGDKIVFSFDYIYRDSELIGTRIRFSNGKASSYQELTEI